MFSFYAAHANLLEERDEAVEYMLLRHRAHQQDRRHLQPQDQHQQQDRRVDRHKSA